MSMAAAAAAITAVLLAALMARASAAAAGRVWADEEKGAHNGTARRQVTYDGRSLMLDGARRMLFSGDIHYPRSTPEMWPRLIESAREGGLDVIQTYVFWNVHEPIQGQYNFEGRYDLVKFIREIHAQGLYVSLRVGPFIEAEWKYGGLPFWLRGVPNITFRCDNEPYKVHMQKFVAKIVNMMKDEKLYYPQGGPIIISQIENEYKLVEGAFHSRGPPYVRWAAAMAVNLQTGVPWMMCKQDDAPDPIYHGGTNFGRFASSYVTTSYYDGAPLDEYGLIWQSTWSHLRELHAAVKQSEEPLLSGSYSTYSFGEQQEGHVFETESNCVAFLVNLDKHKTSNIQFGEASFQLAPKSISILSSCRRVVFETAKVSQLPSVLQPLQTCRECFIYQFYFGQVNAQHGLRTAQVVQSLNNVDSWKIFKEPIPLAINNTTHIGHRFFEHLSTTKDETDYLWYLTRYDYRSNGDTQLVLNVESQAHVLHAYINNDYVGSVHGSHDGPRNIILKTPITLRKGQNSISLLSVMVGSPDSGAYMERRIFGVRKVSIQQGDHKSHSLNNELWKHQIGLSGEMNNIYTPEGSSRAQWTAINKSMHLPLIWYKTTFDTPWGNDPVTLNLSSMGKGEVWINGESIGRYWASFKTPSGQPSQSLYHVPQYFLKPRENTLVLMEEMGGDPLQISVNTMSVTRVYSSVNELSTPSLLSRRKHPAVRLRCQQGKRITDIEFASYGNPAEDCRSSSRSCLGSCHAETTEFVVKDACLGRRKCAIPVRPAKFGGDPCPGIEKSLSVVASCG
ncbi:beta-galactosidase 7 isoform X4 [Triticum aestivum]|uniref:beta-galactosidase 7 isoform X4 n=1 Tax=Triticum aestivum TaxID=4565 RepID=UPI001D01FAA7|nr:beta-galactosidase 7-like isoform X4 [Triticum aestivum]